jgi:hypothetical protein
MPFAIDENQREGGTRGEKRGMVVGFFQYTRHDKGQGIGKEQHTREHKCSIHSKGTSTYVH